MVQDYERHSQVYQPEVIGSKILFHQGDDFKVFLRLKKKKVVTIVLNTEHDVHYSRLDDKRWQTRSYSTHIAEVENPGKPGEHELPVGKDHGFLWRLDSYWRFQERDGGVYVADPQSLARLQQFADAAPALEENKLEQIAALPLGSRVKLNPWDNRLELIKTRPLSLLSPREKMPFEVTPFVLYLTRSDAAAR